MCAMIEKLRMRCRDINAVPCKRSAILAQLGDGPRVEAVLADHLARNQDRHVAAVLHAKVGVGIDVDLVEIDTGGAQGTGHLLAEMAAVPAVQPSLCQ